MDKPNIAQKFPIVKDMAAGTYYWCACGNSKNQPSCDGSHKGTGFTPKPVVIAEPKKVAWCACKYSKNAPFCDGTHRNLPA